MNETQQDKSVVRQVVKEALSGNSDAIVFVSQCQQGLYLSGLYDIYANRIMDVANNLSMTNRSKLASDGIHIANRLKANAKLLRFAIAKSTRSAWVNIGERPIPESKGILTAREIINTPLKLKSSPSEIVQVYGEDARFFIPLVSNKELEDSEKMTLYNLRRGGPAMNNIIPQKVLDYYGIIEKPTNVFLLSYFNKRLNVS